jgi:hypothetical protein
MRARAITFAKVFRDHSRKPAAQCSRADATAGLTAPGQVMLVLLNTPRRAWKGHDWDALDRLYRKGMICDPVGKAKSVVLTDEGLAESERLFRELFAKSAG